MLFETLGDRKNPAVLFFPCNGCDGLKQPTRCAVFEKQIFLHYADIHRLLQRTKISRKR